MSLLPEKFYLDDFFDDFVPMPKMPKNEMKCDIYEKGGRVHIELDVPGFNKDDVKVDLDDGILTIAAVTIITTIGLFFAFYDGGLDAIPGSLIIILLALSGIGVGIYSIGVSGAGDRLF